MNGHSVYLLEEGDRLARLADPGERTKKLIARKAKKLFEQKGYFATTMEEIHSVTGFSKGSIYYHFKNKEGLFLYILEASSQQWKDKWDEISAPLHTATEKIYKLAEHYASDLQTPLIKTAIEFVSSEIANPKVHEQIIQWINSDQIVFRQLLEEGMRNGELKETPIDDLSPIVNGLYNGIYNGLSMTQSEQDVSHIYKMYRMATDILLKGIAK